MVNHPGTKAGSLLAVSAIGLAFLLACAAPANGQVTMGKNLTMLMNGTLGTVYSGNKGNYIGSSHSLGLGINGTLEGSYYNPQFLYFQVRPYYDRSQLNSESQTVTSGQGVEASANLFGGSHFPGSINYAKTFNSNSEFGIAGVPSVLGDSSGSNFGVAWNALFEGYPSLQASYSIADSTSTLLGTTEQGSTSSRSFNLNSNYTLKGFNLQGRLGHYDTDLFSPSFLTAIPISSTSSTTHYGVTAMRRLPLSGSLGFGASRTTTGSEFDDQASNSYTASASISPWQRFSLSGYCNYTTNAIVAYEQALVGNSPLPLTNTDLSSSATYLNTTGTFMIGRGLTATGYVNHRIQHFQGQDASNTQYGGTVNFQKENSLFGFLRFSIGIVNTANQDGNNAVGLVTNVGASHKFGQWETNADFNYSQYTQTLFDIVTTSNYSYGGMLRRKINSSTRWTLSFREGRSGLTAQQGNNNLSDSAITNFTWNKYSFSGSYSKAHGEALLGADGTLIPTPVGSLISPDFLTVDARSYALFASTQLFRVLTLSAGYTNVTSSAVQKAIGTYNNGDRYSARITLTMRRLFIIGGFDRSMQTSSAVPGGPHLVNSYYVSLSRWFNVF